MNTMDLNAPAVPLTLSDLTPDTMLTSFQLATLLTEAGYPTSARELRKLQATSDGPLYSTEPRYRWRNGMTWAIGRRTKKHRRAPDTQTAKQA